MAHGSDPNYSSRPRYVHKVSCTLDWVIYFIVSRYAQFVKFQKAVSLETERGQHRKQAIAKQVMVSTNDTCI